MISAKDPVGANVITVFTDGEWTLRWNQTAKTNRKYWVRHDCKHAMIVRGADGFDEPCPDCGSVVPTNLRGLCMMMENV